VVDAGGVDGFYDGSLDRVLRIRGIDTLVLCGYGAEAAVSSTLRSANDRGYECLTLTDATAPFDAGLGAHDLHSITMSGGIFGAMAGSEALLAVLATARVEALT
jgi:nicotinamidase-related amidase